MRTICAVGAYGTNNVGDDFIFDGLRSAYRKHPIIQIYINKPNHYNSIWIGDVINNKRLPDCEKLIVGGGGLIHSREAVQSYVDVAKVAKSKGIPVSIERVGFEGINCACEDVTIELLNLADSVSVRSSISKGIVNYLGFDCRQERDFAYENTISYVYR